MEKARLVVGSRFSFALTSTRVTTTRYKHGIKTSKNVESDLKKYHKMIKNWFNNKFIENSLAVEELNYRVHFTILRQLLSKI